MKWSFRQYLYESQSKPSMYDSQVGMKTPHHTTIWIPEAPNSTEAGTPPPGESGEFSDKTDPAWEHWLANFQHHILDQLNKGANPIKATIPNGSKQPQIHAATTAAQKTMEKHGHPQAQVTAKNNEIVISYTPSFNSYLAKRGSLRHLSPKKVDEMIRQAVMQSLEKRKNFPLAGNFVIEIPQPGYTHIDSDYFEKRIEFFLRTEFKDHAGHPFEHDSLRVLKIWSDKPGIMRFQVEGMEKNWQDRVFDYAPHDTGSDLWSDEDDKNWSNKQGRGNVSRTQAIRLPPQS